MHAFRATTVYIHRMYILCFYLRKFAETAVTHVQWITEMEERMTSMRVASLDQVHLLAGFPSEQTNQLLIESLQKKSMESPNGSLQDLLCLYDEVETKMKSIHQELTQRQGMTEQLCCLASDLSALVNSSWAETRASEVKSRLVAATDLACSHLVRIHEDRQKAKTFQNAAQDHLVWCLDAEQALKALDLSGDEGSFQNVSKQLTDWMQKLESQHFILAESESMAEDILHVCPPGGAAIILRWARIIRGRFDEVQACANGIQTRIAANRFALEKDTRRAEELMSWLARMQDMMAEEEIEPEKAEVTKECLARHQALVTEMTALQPEVDRLVRLYRRRGLSDPLSPISSSSTLSPSTPSTQPDFRSGTSPGSQVSNQSSPPVPMGCSSPQLQPLLTLWQRVWLAVLDRQGRLRETQNNPQEKKEDKKDNEDFFTTWGWRCLQWAGHRRLRVLDYFCRLDKDQDGLIHRQDFIQALLDSKTGINDEEATTIARMFEKGGGLVDYYELVEALTSAPTRGQPQTDADKIDDEVTRKVAACRCPKRFQVEQIEENKYRFGESQQLRLVRILRSAVMVRVGGGWSSLDEFLLKNDPCRASVDGCSTMDMRNRLSVPDGKGLTAAAFQPKPRRSPLGRSPSAPSLPQQISGAPAIINPKGKVSRASSQRSVKSRTPVAKTSQSSASSPSNRSGCGSKKLSRSRSLGKPEDLMAWETVASRVYSQTDIAHQSESRQVHTGAHQPNGKSSRIPTAMPTSALSRKTSNRWR